MAKKSMPNKQSVSKGKFDIEDFKKKKNIGQEDKAKDKELSWLPLSEGFHDAVNIPGVPRGYITLFRGFSNTGKSTAIYEVIRACQRSEHNDLPIIIDTEGNFDWGHAANIGVEFEEVVDEETGEVTDYKGDFIFVDGKQLKEMYKYFDYKEGKEKQKAIRNVPVIEDVARFINDLLASQEEGELPRNLCFLWDSIGSLDSYECVVSNTANNMWNAGALERHFKNLINFRLPSSRKEDQEYTNTFAAVQKIWLDSQQPGQPVVKHKGGEAFYYGARLIIHLGGTLSHGTQLLKATTKGRSYQFGVETKIKSDKNQVNGVEMQGKICSTPHGFLNPDKKSEYTTNYKEHILEKMNLQEGEITVKEEESELSGEDTNG